MNATNGFQAASSAFQAVAGSKGIVGVLGQQFESKGAWGKKKRTLEKMIAHWKASQNSYVARWQALTLFNDPVSALRLTQEIRPLDAENNNYTMKMPMYCFNLSSLPFNRMSVENSTPVTSVSFPVYRLQKNHQAASGFDTYSWEVVSGVNNDKSGVGNSTGWNVEWDTLNGSAPIQTNKYCWDWADIKTAFTGCKRPTKMHVGLCKFLHTGPLRKYYTGTDVIEFDSDTNAQESQDEVVAWDHFWSRKVSNPIRTSRKPTNFNEGTPFKIFKHESFVLGQDTSINQDPKPLQAVFNKFYSTGYLYNCDAPSFSFLQGNNIIGDNDGGAAFGFVGVNANPNAINSQPSLFPPRDKDQWLMIWADTYDQWKYDAPTGSAGTWSSTNSTDYNEYAISFDINLRCKYSYND